LNFFYWHGEVVEQDLELLKNHVTIKHLFPSFKNFLKAVLEEFTMEVCFS
jgi:hypothetical protein